MPDYLEEYPDTLHSDNGAPCPVCYGTVFRFKVPADLIDVLTEGKRDHEVTVKVETYCFTCHRTDAFFAGLRWNPSASAVSAAHRAAHGMREVTR